MRALTRKLWRDFWHLRGQSLAIALVVMGGLATLVMALSNHQALTATRERFYREHHYADLFATVRRAPLALLQDIRAIEGVRRAEGRIRAIVPVELPGVDEPMSAQVVSTGDGDLNRLFLREGEGPRAPDEVVVGEAFAEAHGLHPGDRVTAILNGRRQSLRITGIGLSPEFIYQIRPGDVFPDFARFAVFWMARDGLAAAFDLSGGFNDLVIALESAAVPREVMSRIDALLLPYGGLRSGDRSQQTSHRFLDEELMQLRTMTRLFSTIFLGVAAFLLNVVIGRLINTQREQIAVLKAFGYTPGELARHYGALVMAMVAVGLGPALALGAWMGQSIAGIYGRFYRFPYLEWTLEPAVLALAVAAAAAAGLAGAMTGLRRVYRLAPAEAMRPEAPARFGRSLVERAGLAHWLQPAARMVLRQIERRPLRSGLTVIGMGLSCGILVMSNLQHAAIDEMIAVQFGLAQRDDLSVSFIDTAAPRALQELRSVPGVQSAQAWRASPVTLRHGHREYDTALLAWDGAPDIKRVLDAGLRPVTLPPDGLLLTDYLAQLLQVQPGQTLEVDFHDGRRERLPMVVADTVTEYLGVGAYASRAWLNRQRDDGEGLSGAWLRVAGGDKPAVVRTLQQRPRVAAVADRSAAIQSFRDTMAENVLVFSFVATLLAASITVGVVYNAARITLAERARDLASLRILGYTPAEVRGLWLGELATLTLLAVLPGFVMGWAMSAWLMRGFQSEFYRIPLVIAPSNFAFGATVLLASAAVSAALVVRRLDRLDLVAVLKTRE